jgi:putative methionine-R-sulfoxide reductase with GAF domain
MKDGLCYGVLDVDSPILSRFSLEDQAGLVRIVTEMMNHSMWMEREGRIAD